MTPRGDAMTGLASTASNTSPSSIAISENAHDHVRQRVEVDRGCTAPSGQQRPDAQRVEQPHAPRVRHRRTGHRTVVHQLHQRAARGDHHQRTEGAVAHEADRHLDTGVDHRLDGHRRTERLAPSPCTPLAARLRRRCRGPRRRHRSCAGHQRFSAQPDSRLRSAAASACSDRVRGPRFHHRDPVLRRALRSCRRPSAMPATHRSRRVGLHRGVGSIDGSGQRAR